MKKIKPASPYLVQTSIQRVLLANVAYCGRVFVGFGDTLPTVSNDEMMHAITRNKFTICDFFVVPLNDNGNIKFGLIVKISVEPDDSRTPSIFTFIHLPHIYVAVAFTWTVNMWIRWIQNYICLYIDWSTCGTINGELHTLTLTR